MLSDDLRLRLEQLNRQPLPTLPAAVPARQPATLPDAVPLSPPIAECPRPVRYLAAGRDVENPAGRHLAIVHPLSHFAWEIAGQLQRAQSAWRTVDFRSLRVHPDIASLGSAFPDDVLLLDLETCGLGGAMIFLVGLVHARDEAIVVEQLLARNYAEERAILASLWRIAAVKRTLVTFNGKSFDWPLVHDRSTLHRLGRREYRAVPAGGVIPDLLGPHDTRPELMHVDLLHHARRRWRRMLPNCRLQTLERYLCRRVRHDDVPGHAIPQAYHDFVRGGQQPLMESILHHNALDLLTMAQVAMRMLVESASHQPAGESNRAGLAPDRQEARSA